MKDFTIRQLAEKISLWTARAENAQQTGKSDLLKKALKYKSRFEQELANYQKLLFEAERQHDANTPETSIAEWAQEHGCFHCYFCTNYEPYEISLDLLPNDTATIAKRLSAAGMLKSDFEIGPDEKEYMDEVIETLCETHRQQWLTFQAAVLQMP